MMNKEELIKHLNMLRQSNTNAWVFFAGFCDDIKIQYKAYGTWVQRLEIDNTVCSCCADISVKDYISFLNEVL